MFKKSILQVFIISAISGAIVGLSLNTGWWILTILGCMTFVYTFWLLPMNKKIAFWFGFIFGTTKLLTILAWGFAVFPISWLGDFSAITAVLFLGLYWLLAASCIGIATGIATLCVCSLRFTIYSVIILALALVLSESLGALIYSVVFSGSGSYLQAYFSFGFTGYGIASNDYFLNLAALGGVYSLSLYIYVLSGMLVYSIKSKSFAASLSVFFILLIPIALQPELYKPQQKEIAIINTNFTAELLQTDNGENIKSVNLKNAIAFTLESNVSDILLPEDSRFTTSFATPNIAHDWFKLQSGTTSVVLYDSSRASENNKTILRGYVLDSTAQEVWHYDKNYLVPQGEFLPFFAEIFLAFSQDSNWKEQIYNHLSYRPSNQTNYPDNKNVAPFLFCFEAVNPLGIYNALKRHQGNFVVHPVSHAWFTKQSPGLRTQLEQMLRVQAVWNNAPIVVAGNMFTGFVVYPDGTIETGDLIKEEEYWNIYKVNL